jgi:hypothetical protein
MPAARPEAKAVPPKLGSLNDRGESLGAVCLAKKTPVQSIALIEDTDKRSGGQPAFSRAAAMPLRSVRMAAASTATSFSICAAGRRHPRCAAFHPAPKSAVLGSSTFR